MRLNRYLALAGLGSRRNVESLILEGRVEVNGETVETPSYSVDPEKDRVTFDGERVRAPRSQLYLLMNKPSGVVVTASDERGRTTVYDLLPDKMRGRVRAVGRLDRASEGLLLFTNDGELSHALLHPSRGVKKSYLAWVTPTPDLDSIRALRAGLPIGRGERSGKAAVKLLGSRKATARLRLTLTEGKNREVRRMFRAVGCKVLALRRVEIGGVRLERTRPGGHRILTRAEVAQLRRAADAGAKTETGKAKKSVRTRGPKRR